MVVDIMRGYMTPGIIAQLANWAQPARRINRRIQATRQAKVMPMPTPALWPTLQESHFCGNSSFL